MIQSFKGFKGTCATAQIGKIQFCLLAKNPRQLAILWEAILQQAGPLSPEMLQRAIIIEATVLPPARAKKLSPVTPPTIET